MADLIQLHLPAKKLRNWQIIKIRNVIMGGIHVAQFLLYKYLPDGFSCLSLRQAHALDPKTQENWC